MKNILKHAVPAIWILFGTLWGQHAAAAIDAKISFETEIPKAFVCGENSTAELSGLHYKDGSRSLRWSWSAPSTLRFNDFGQLMRSLRVKGAGVMLWIYNPRAVDADMRFSFETPTGEVPYRFDFHMDFTAGAPAGSSTTTCRRPRLAAGIPADNLDERPGSKAANCSSTA